MFKTYLKRKLLNVALRRCKFELSNTSMSESQQGSKLTEKESEETLGELIFLFMFNLMTHVNLCQQIKTMNYYPLLLCLDITVFLSITLSHRVTFLFPSANFYPYNMYAPVFQR